MDRRQVLDMCARVKRGGVVFCTPSQKELHGFRKEPEGTDGKVIYDTECQARIAGDMLWSLGARPMVPYACKRSRHGHFHLATAP